LNLFEREGFLEHRERAEVGRLLTVQWLKMARNQDNRELGLLDRQALRKLKPIHHRHLDIADDNVKLLHASHLQRGLAVLRLDYFEASPRERTT
jgi:hypothetical protein